jgi:hypothetical protein
MKSFIKLFISFVVIVFLGMAVRSVATTWEPFVMRIVDAETDRGIPLVNLELENGLKLVSDNEGYIAIIAPDLEGNDARFKLTGHGYTTGQKDFWGAESVICPIIHGQTRTVALKRNQLAHRLYRVTGAGRYNHSLIAGKKPSFKHYDKIPGNVIGQDSLICLPWQNRLWHFYGDTLGLNGFNFSASCATAPMPEQGEYDPETGIPLSYIVDKNGFARAMIETGKKGFTWIEYVVPVEFDGFSMQETLMAKYVQHATLDKVEEAGFAIFLPARKQFAIVKRIKNSKPHRCTHPVKVKFAQHERWLLFPWEMAEASFHSLIDEAKHFYFSPLIATADSDGEFMLEGRAFRLDRNAHGKVRYSWRRGGIGIDAKIQAGLLKQNVLLPEQALFAPVDLDSGKRVTNFNGAITFNRYKKRWIAINQGNHPGQLVYAEADTPTGPWAFARQITKFEDYNLYNPLWHPWFSKNNDKTVFFEGTYTNYFSASACRTPEADYNQVMFKLNLDLPELIMPIPIYRVRVAPNKTELLDFANAEKLGLIDKIEAIAFFAFSNNEKNPDLKNILALDGSKYAFKALSNKPVTEWGKSWFSDKLRHLLIDAPTGKVVAGKVLRPVHTALSFSESIMPIR